MLRRDGEAVRVGPWRGAADTALLAPAPGVVGPVSPPFLRWCARLLSGRGFSRVVSAALLPTDTASYREAGFTTFEQLHLLSRDLSDLPPMPATPAVMRRARRRDLGAVVALDHAAFQPFWRFDADGIVEARTITPRARFRVSEVGGQPAGYAVTGLGEQQGYLQRLAVSPDLQRRHIGSALVIDALEWLARRRAVRVMVNTQLSNEPAVAVYLSLGFRLEPVRLEVLALDLGARTDLDESSPSEP